MIENKESRPQTIWRHVHAFINKSAISWPTFAAGVRDIYEDIVPEHARLIQWSGHRDTHTRMKMDAQTLRRFEHDVKFGLPSELEEALVIALQEMSYPQYNILESELAARYGLIAARLPESNGIQHVGDLTRQFGEALQAMAPIIEDGKIDFKDKPHAKRAINELSRVIASAICVSNQVASILNENTCPTARAV